MRRSWVLGLGGAVAMLLACGLGAAPVPTDEVRAAILESVHEAGDVLEVEDPRTGESLELTFDKIHDEVRPAEGNRYVACADFKNTAGSVYDVDYYVAREGDAFRVVDVVLHRIDGESVLAAED